MAEGRVPVKRLWDAQHRRYALWCPAFVGIGVWVRLESGWVVLPPLSLVSLFLLGCGGYFAAWRRGMALGVFLSAGIGLVATGYLAGMLRIASVDAPVLTGDFRGQVTGRIVAVDRSRSEVPRVTLDRLKLSGLHVSATPRKIRVSLIDLKTPPKVGSVIVLRAVLSPPAGPAAPGAFDFSRQAFFRQIGAVGYARGGLSILESESGRSLWLAKLRSEISLALRTRIEGDAGAVAAALIVGEKSHITAKTTQDLRDSGLAHLLAISGLHIGLMSTLMFWLVRFGLALLGGFASRVPIKKIAAVAGLAAAAGYLALAGFGVATQRAFVMAAVAFTAILLDRPAVTFRGLAAAACVVLLARPESLFEAGFQMSFSAAAALVAGYEATKSYWRSRAENPSLVARFFTALQATAMTSIVAGAATMPFAAYHFNRLVAYGLPANILATPVMGLWIMPGIILTAVLIPFGLSGMGLAVLGWGIGYILWIANYIASFEGAAWSVPAGESSALAIITFGGLWLFIWRGPLRTFALIPLIFGVLLWRNTLHPDLFISEQAQLIAGRLDDGSLWVSRKRSSGYSAETWLRRSGEGDTEQVEAFNRRKWRCAKNLCQGTTTNNTKVFLIRNRSFSAVKKLCTEGAIIIAPKIQFSSNQTMHCTIIDRAVIGSASSLSVRLSAGTRPLIETASPTAFKGDQ